MAYSALFDTARFDESYFNREFSNYSIETLLQEINSPKFSFSSLLQSLEERKTALESIFSKINHIAHKLNSVIEELKALDLSNSALVSQLASIQQAFDSLIQEKEEKNVGYDALLKSINRLEMKVNALLLQSNSLKNYIDSLTSQPNIARSMVLQSLINTHKILAEMFDVVLEIKQITTYDISAVIQSYFTIKSHLDSLLKISRILSTNISTIVKTSIQCDFELAAIAQRTSILASKFSSLLALLNKEVSYTADTIISGSFPILYKIQSVIGSANFAEHRLSSILLKEMYKAYSSDAITEFKSLNISHMIRTLLSKMNTKDFDFNTTLWKIQELNIPIDAKIKAKNAIEMMFSSLIKGEYDLSYEFLTTLVKTIGVENTLNVLLSSTQNITLILNALLSILSEIQYNLNSLLSKKVENKIRVDAVIGAATFASNFFDALIYCILQNVFKFNASLSKMFSYNHSLDAFINNIQHKNIPFNSQLSKIKREMLQYSAIILQLGILRQFALDVVLQRTPFLNMSIDANLNLGIPIRKYSFSSILYGSSSSSLAFTANIFRPCFIDKIVTSMFPIMEVSANMLTVC